MNAASAAKIIVKDWTDESLSIDETKAVGKALDAAYTAATPDGTNGTTILLPESLNGLFYEMEECRKVERAAVLRRSAIENTFRQAIGAARLGVTEDLRRAFSRIVITQPEKVIPTFSYKQFRGVKVPAAFLIGVQK